MSHTPSPTEPDDGLLAGASVPRELPERLV
jgi:hypothetical protein